MSAPERIWATPFDEDMEGGTYCDATTRPTAPNHDAWCYIRADLANGGWQPIETAPKDGTHVLLSYPGRITYGYWLVLEVGKLVGDCGGACRCPEYDEAPDPFWYSEDGGFTEEYPPTHWMPLPEPAP